MTATSGSATVAEYPLGSRVFVRLDVVGRWTAGVASCDETRSPDGDGSESGANDGVVDTSRSLEADGSDVFVLEGGEILADDE